MKHIIYQIIIIKNSMFPINNTTELLQKHREKTRRKLHKSYVNNSWSFNLVVI